MKKPLDHQGDFVFSGTICHARTVVADDIEILRVWKNDKRQYFHYQEIISPQQQQRWFATFEQDPSQQLFVCEIDQELVACIGFRIKTAIRVELFNLICAHPAYRGQGLATQLFEFMRSQLAAKGFCEIELEVLKNNPAALSWYLKRGFRQVGEGPTWLHLLLTP